MTTLVAPVMGPRSAAGSPTYFVAVDFYINIPVGVFAAAATWSIYSKRETARRKLPSTASAWRCSSSGSAR